MANPFELVDIVTEDGTTIDTVTKQEAHEHGLLHACVIGQVINSQGEWLLVRQASDRQDAGQYVCPIGGHVSSGESSDDALKREANEELGFINPFPYTKVGTTVYNRTILGRHENHLFIVYTVTSDEQPTLGNESVEYRYFTVEEIQRLSIENPTFFGDSFYFVWNTFFQKNLS